MNPPLSSRPGPVTRTSSWERLRVASLQFLKSDLGHYLPFVLLAAAVFTVDQWSKSFVTAYVQSTGQGEVGILGGVVFIHPIRNTGAAFGVFPNQPWLLSAIALLLVGGLLISFRRVARGPITIRIGLALVLGGALGNLFDRIRLGSVRDFIDVRWWPVFNVADSCIVIGVLVLIGTMLFRSGMDVATQRVDMDAAG